MLIGKQSWKSITERALIIMDIGKDLHSVLTALCPPKKDDSIQLIEKG